MNRALIFTSSGGNGHKMVADYLSRELKESSNLSARVDDIMLDYLGDYIGVKCVDQWNQAQANGDINKLNALVNKQSLANHIFFIPIFLGALKSLFSLRPRVVLNTQVMGLRALLCAVVLYNLVMKILYLGKWEDIKVETWMSDLPERARHFYDPIYDTAKWLTKNLVLKVVPPRWEDGSPMDREETIEYISKRTRLSKNQIHLLNENDLPVSKIYKDNTLEAFAPGNQVELTLKLDYEQKALTQSLPNIQENYNSTNSAYRINESEKVITLMLGSQPTKDIVMNTLSILSRKAKYAVGTSHIFLFCGLDQGKSLYKEVIANIKTTNLPSNLKIIPLPFQPFDDTAKILTRSNDRFTRMGGGTIFQFLAEKHTIGERAGRIHLFSESRLSKLQIKRRGTKSLMKSMVVWERGNAEHAIKALNAKVVCRATFSKMLKRSIAEPQLPTRL